MKGNVMPLARIDMIRGQSPVFRRGVGDAVYEAMVEILKAPAGTASAIPRRPSICSAV